MPGDLPKSLLVIDPGKVMGWAFFHGGVLVWCGHCTQKALQTGKLSAQAKRNGHALPPETLPEDCVILGERPEYRNRSGANVATPKDLISLGVQLGQAIGLYMRKVGVVEFVTPTEWKGNVPKDICHRRVEKVLEPNEQMPENHNARDAVGIGLWRLGRYKR